MRPIDHRTVTVDGDFLFPDTLIWHGKQMAYSGDFTAHVTDDGWLIVATGRHTDRIPPGRWHRCATPQPEPEPWERDVERRLGRKEGL